MAGCCPRTKQGQTSKCIQDKLRTNARHKCAGRQQGSRFGRGSFRDGRRRGGVTSFVRLFGHHGIGNRCNGQEHTPRHDDDDDDDDDDDKDNIDD